MTRNNYRRTSDIPTQDIRNFESLFRKYHGNLVIFASKFTTDIQDARDIVQDVFLNLWNKPGFTPSSPGPYLFKAVKNKCLNHIRHQKTSDKPTEDLSRYIQEFESSLYLREENPLHSLLETELEEKIQAAVNLLPEKCRQVFILSRKENLQNKEIAKKLGISVKAVEKHITKALAFLRKELKDYFLLLCLIFFS